jgi:hypothetical protein
LKPFPGAMLIGCYSNVNREQFASPSLCKKPGTRYC